jgi:hypothetical protein
MRTTLESLRSYAVKATDHDLGHIKDCYADDRHWAIRYLVVDTNKWLPGRKVLIAPAAVKDIDLAMKEIRLNLTKKQVEEAPAIDEHLPVSKQVAQELDRHFGWNHYWITGGLVGFGLGPTPSFGPLVEAAEVPLEFHDLRRTNPGEDPNLQSLYDLKGYKIKNIANGATDLDAAGTVADVVINWFDGAVPFLVIDTGHWLPGRFVALPTALIDSIDHLEQSVATFADRTVILDAPAFEGLSSLAEGGDRTILAHYRSQFLRGPGAGQGFDQTLGRPASLEPDTQNPET